MRPPAQMELPLVAVDLPANRALRKVAYGHAYGAPSCLREDVGLLEPTPARRLLLTRIHMKQQASEV